MQQVIDELRPQPIEVGFEATYGWGWFADQLAELGVPAHMAHPLATKAVSSARVKNDAVDAKTLAHLLRTNLLPEGWIAPAEVREARRLVRMRASLVRLRAKLKAQVHALLGEHGIQPEVVDLFGKKGRSVLDELQLPAVSRSRLGACLRLIDEMTLEIVLAEREIYDSIKEDERVNLSASPSGVAPRSLGSRSRDGCSRSPSMRCAAKPAAAVIPSHRTQRSRRARWLSWPPTETAANLIEPPGPNHTMDTRSE